MPSVVYGPGGKWIAHQADEFVEVDDLVTHADVYVEAADRFLRRRAPSTARDGAGPRNDITDVGGVAVGHHPRRGRGWLTGTTVVLPPAGTVGGVDVRGGGPGTRETDLLHPANMVSDVDAICLTGGSAYGLDAAGGVMAVARASTGAASRSAPSRATSCRSCRPPWSSTSAPAATSPSAPTPSSAAGPPTAASTAAACARARSAPAPAPTPRR